MKVRVKRKNKYKSIKLPDIPGVPAKWEPWLIGAILAGIGLYLAPKIGLFGYAGLSKYEVKNVYEKTLSQTKVLSRTCGTDWFGKPFCRGILFNGQHYPLYFRYSEDSFKLYPMLYEDWNTGSDIFSLTGRPA